MPLLGQQAAIAKKKAASGSATVALGFRLARFRLMPRLSPRSQTALQRKIKHKSYSFFE